MAACLGRLGIAVDLAGYSGADPIGEGFRATLAGLGVGLAALARHPTAGTGTSVIAVAPNGERTVVYVNAANALVSLDATPDAWLEGVRVLSVGSVFVLPQFTAAAVARLFRRARRRGAATVLNICPVPAAGALAALAVALAETDYFVLNLDEGRQLTGRGEPEGILGALAAHCRGHVLLTLGGEGCCFRLEGRLVHLPAEPAAAVDCTGAGDAFVAGLIAGLVTHRPPAEAARLGCRVAACAVSGAGAYPRVPPLAELERAGDKR